MVATLTVCRVCGEPKARTREFWPSCKTCSDGLRKTCKVCRNEMQKTPAYRRADTTRSRRYRTANRDEINARRVVTRLIAGMATPAEYDLLLKQQKGGCAICGSKTPPKPSPGHLRRRTLSVDHDHKRLTVRGLLCHGCNAGLGHFRDRIDILQAAITYLALHNAH